MLSFYGCLWVRPSADSPLISFCNRKGLTVTESKHSAYIHEMEGKDEQILRGTGSWAIQRQFSIPCVLQDIAGRWFKHINPSPDCKMAFHSLSACRDWTLFFPTEVSQRAKKGDSVLWNTNTGWQKDYAKWVVVGGDAVCAVCVTTTPLHMH